MNTILALHIAVLILCPNYDDIRRRVPSYLARHPHNTSVWGHNVLYNTGGGTLLCLQVGISMIKLLTFRIGHIIMQSKLLNNNNTKSYTKDIITFLREWRNIFINEYGKCSFLYNNQNEILSSEQ